MGSSLITMEHNKAYMLWATILTCQNVELCKKREYTGISAYVKIGVQFHCSWPQPLTCLYQHLAVLGPSLPTITSCQWLDLG